MSLNIWDVTLNLNDGIHKPYRKPNDETNYILKKSNHPQNINKQIPFSIEKRLPDLSSNKEIFDEAAKYYEQALRKCGYDQKLNYIPPEQNSDIIWFNPPFSKNAS